MTKSKTPAVTRSPDDAYQMIDYLLIDNLNSDEDYKKYSDALNLISNSSAGQPVQPLTDKQLEEIAGRDEFVLSCDVDDFIRIARAVEQAHREISKKLNPLLSPKPICKIPHPAVKSDILVNSGALKLALMVLRRAGKDEVADELEITINQPVNSHD